MSLAHALHRLTKRGPAKQAYEHSAEDREIEDDEAEHDCNDARTGYHEHHCAGGDERDARDPTHDANDATAARDGANEKVRWHRRDRAGDQQRGRETEDEG